MHQAVWITQPITGILYRASIAIISEKEMGEVERSEVNVKAFHQLCIKAVVEVSWFFY